MIKSFKCEETEKIFLRTFTKKWHSDLAKIAKRKLNIIDAACHLNDLKIPPGNKLERLKGNRVDQYSIRVNEQWRICFKWKDSNAYNLEMVDYHK